MFTDRRCDRGVVCPTSVGRLLVGCLLACSLGKDKPKEAGGGVLSTRPTFCLTNEDLGYHQYLAEKDGSLSSYNILDVGFSALSLGAARELTENGCFKGIWTPKWAPH